MMTTLQDLPAELLYSIHLISLSSALPCVSRHLNATFQLSSVRHRANFLRLKHERHTLSHAIKYPICDLPVLRDLELILSDTSTQKRKKLRCDELPRRLVKPLGGAPSRSSSCTSRQIDLPLITYLLDHYGASANSKRGYFLARAVFAKHLPLIRLLLDFGADPSLRNGWAVIAAISMGDLQLVKLLIESPSSTSTHSLSTSLFEVEVNDQNEVKQRGNGKKRLSEGIEEHSRSGKRRKHEEQRCEATSEMLEAAVKSGHWHIVEYLRERGAKPNMNVIKLL